MFYLLLITLLIDAIGWYRLLWFISVGYGASIAAIGVTLGVMYWGSFTLGTALLTGLAVVYGCRLAGYLLRRELKSAAYRHTVSLDAKTDADYSVTAHFFIWVSCALLYVCQMSPLAIRLQSGVGDNVALWIGVCVAATGLLLEAVADHQKSIAKKRDAHRFVSTGLYRLVRCPNYFGEMLFWTGMFISGFGAYALWWHWLLALTGYVAIIYIMFSGARRIELRQDHNYGADPAYQSYKATTPILLPFVPLYSVKKYRWLKG